MRARHRVAASFCRRLRAPMVAAVRVGSRARPRRLFPPALRGGFASLALTGRGRARPRGSAVPLSARRPFLPRARARRVGRRVRLWLRRRSPRAPCGRAPPLWRARCPRAASREPPPRRPCRAPPALPPLGGLAVAAVRGGSNKQARAPLAGLVGRARQRARLTAWGTPHQSACPSSGSSV
jgi:hypothetical protein